jgi:hypothetical protein
MGYIAVDIVVRYGPDSMIMYLPSWLTMPAMPPDKNRLEPLIVLVSVTPSTYWAKNCF